MCYYYAVNMAYLDLQNMQREVNVREIEKGRSSDIEENSVGMFRDNRRRSVDLLVYERDMPTGGKRELRLDGEGEITLEGYDPTLEVMGEEDGEFVHKTDINSLDYPDISDNLQAYSGPDEGGYKELDELLHCVEEDAELLQ